MRRRRWLRPALVGALVLVVAAAAAFANVALLGAVGEDRIGRLRPVDPGLSATLGTAPAGATSTGAVTVAPAPAVTAPIVTDGDDDGSRRGRGRGRSGDSDDD